MRKRLKNALWNSYLSMATRLFRNTPLFLVLGMGLFGSEVYGQCTPDPLDGAWKNIDPSNNGRLEFNQICNDTPYCDRRGCHNPSTKGALRVLVACTPFPCDWGWTDVFPQSPWYRGTYAQFLDYFYTERTVLIRYDVPGNVVAMATYTDYRGRQPPTWRWDYYRRAAMTVEPDVDRPGGDYRSFDLPAPEYSGCENACADDLRCQAYTYVPPGVQGPSARCWLKDRVPSDISSWGMLSGWRR